MRDNLRRQVLSPLSGGDDVWNGTVHRGGEREVSPHAGRCACHIGSVVLVTKASRTQETRSLHKPVTNANPTPTSRMPPKI